MATLDPPFADDFRDLLTDFDEAARDAGTFMLEGRAIPFIGRAALLKNKKAAALEKHRVTETPRTLSRGT